MFVAGQQSDRGNMLNILDSVFDGLVNVGMDLTTTRLNVKNTTFSRIMQTSVTFFTVRLNRAGQDVTFEDMTLE